MEDALLIPLTAVTGAICLDLLGLRHDVSKPVLAHAEGLLLNWLDRKEEQILSHVFEFAEADGVAGEPVPGGDQKVVRPDSDGMRAVSGPGPPGES